MVRLLSLSYLIVEPSQVLNFRAAENKRSSGLAKEACHVCSVSIAYNQSGAGIGYFFIFFEN